MNNQPQIQEAVSYRPDLTFSLLMHDAVQLELLKIQCFRSLP